MIYALKTARIDPELYSKYDVKRESARPPRQGCIDRTYRNRRSRSAYTIDDDEMVPCEGKLYYRGVDIEKKLLRVFCMTTGFGFEEVVYLHLSVIPLRGQLKISRHLCRIPFAPDKLCARYYHEGSSQDMMNTLSWSVLTLYAYDENPDDTSVANVLRQCSAIDSNVPFALGLPGIRRATTICTGTVCSFTPHLPSFRLPKRYCIPCVQTSSIPRLRQNPGFGARCTRRTRRRKTTPLYNARSIIIGTDTYSTIAASLGSLKGPHHGGANKKYVLCLKI